MAHTVIPPPRGTTATLELAHKGKKKENEIIAWTRFRINSQKCIGSQWAVRVRDSRRDSGRAEQPESWAWYKLSGSISN